MAPFFVAMVAIIAYALFEHTQTRSTMTTEIKKDDGYLIAKIANHNTPESYEAFQEESRNWIFGQAKEDRYSCVHIMNMTWNYLREATRQKPKAELAKEIAFEILCNEWADGYILDMKSIYEEKEDPKNPYAGLNEEAQFRLDELQDIILLVLKGGEK